MSFNRLDSLRKKKKSLIIFGPKLEIRSQWFVAFSKTVSGHISKREAAATSGNVGDRVVATVAVAVGSVLAGAAPVRWPAPPTPRRASSPHRCCCGAGAHIKKSKKISDDHVCRHFTHSSLSLSKLSALCGKLNQRQDILFKICKSTNVIHLMYYKPTPRRASLPHCFCCGGGAHI